jgi:hypothetical protein
MVRGLSMLQMIDDGYDFEIYARMSSNFWFWEMLGLEHWRTIVGTEFVRSGSIEYVRLRPGSEKSKQDGSGRAIEPAAGERSRCPCGCGRFL